MAIYLKSFSGLEQGIYNISVEYYNLCEAEGGLTTVLLQCNDEELNFRCDRWVLGEKEREKALIARDVEELNKANEQEKINKTASSLYQTSNSKTELASSTYFYHWDHLGTARLITDNSGKIFSRHDFEPFGVENPPYNETASNTHKFTGHERDSSTGFDYMHFRFYASSMGRFMKPDNKLGELFAPQSFNLYAYVQQNPINLRDPNGHEILTTIVVTTAVCGLVITGVMVYIIYSEKSNARERAQEKNPVSQADQIIELNQPGPSKWNEDVAEIAIAEAQETMDALKPAVEQVVPAAPGSQVGGLLNNLIEMGDKIATSISNLLGNNSKEKKDEEKVKGKKGKEKKLPVPVQSIQDDPQPNEEVK